MLVAFMLVLLAGATNGSFAVPMKHVRGWQWEHTWLIWSLIGMFVIPVAVAIVTVPSLGAVYRTAGLQPLAATALYGMIWGVGTILFGLGITRVGLAISFGIVLGISCSLGTIIPLAVLHRDRLFTAAGLLMLAGVALILGGVAVGAWAGLLREAAVQEHHDGSFMAGLFICLLSGVGSSFMSLALNESTRISKAAENLGSSRVVSLNAVWPVLLGGGLAVNAVYCIFLLVRRGNAALFGVSTWTNIGLAALMAVLWSGSNFVYSAGARWMGSLGLVLGWPIFMAMIVLAANAWGLLTGEWRSAGRRTVSWAVTGCLLLIAGIWIIALAGNRS